MIRLEGLTKVYEGAAAVDDMTLEVGEGEVCVLIGPSGCGKTTTLRMINRLIEPTSGTVYIDGEDVSTLDVESLRRRLGYVIQSIGLFPHLRVEENIAVVPKLLGWDAKRIHDRVRELLDLVGLAADRYAAKWPAELSGGEAQRIGVARALAADPPALLMDEPFGAVDPLNRVRLQDEFARIQQELRKTVILVTHDIDEAIRLADRIAIMRAGRLMQYDTPEEILEHPSDKFVHDFVGADRALKRLVRVPVREAMYRRPTAMTREEARRAASSGGEGEVGVRYPFLVDEQGRLEGWLDFRDVASPEDIDDAVTLIDPAEQAVLQETSLKDALSRMLGMGFRYLPVVDEEGRLVGDLGLSMIEEAMSGGESAEGPLASESSARAADGKPHAADREPQAAEGEPS